MPGRYRLVQRLDKGPISLYALNLAVRPKRQRLESYMSRTNVEQRIVRGHRLAGKTHAFNDGHDPNKPFNIFFQDSHEGLILFVIFYTQACQWERCLGCNLSSTAAKGHISFRQIMRQVDNLFSSHEVLHRAKEIRKVIVSNQGSVLDEDTFSTTALVYFAAKCNELLPNLAVLTLESRAEYVDEIELAMLARILKEGETPTTLEIAIGFEIFDDHIRNHMFVKGLTRTKFESMVEQLAKYSFRVKCYFMFKPVPHMTNEEAVRDIELAIDYLSQLQDRIPGSAISIHLNPTYAARGTPLEVALTDSTFVPPMLRDVIRAVRHGEGRDIPIFVGLDDEGLAAPGGSFIREGDEERVLMLNTFNATQNYSVLTS